jgi:hypothetical protein
MSNAYINSILFGFSKTDVNDEYIRGMLPYMLSEERLKIIEEKEKERGMKEPELLSVPSEKPTTLNPLVKPDRIIFAERKKHNQNSLFWAIYEVEYPEEAFLGTRANAEVEHRLKVVTELKKTPKRLKETNSKLTIEQTQALFGSMLVAKEDKLEFCAAYSAYYNKPIIVVYQKTYRLFSPMIDVDLKDEDAIILYANKPEYEKGKHIVYSSEKNPSSKIICDIMENKVMGPLKTMSNYKNSELDDIARKFGIQITLKTDSGKEKRRKKEDIYNDIKVAIHNDQN